MHCNFGAGPGSGLQAEIEKLKSLAVGRKAGLLEGSSSGAQG